MVDGVLGSAVAIIDHAVEVIVELLKGILYARIP